MLACKMKPVEPTVYYGMSPRESDNIFEDCMDLNFNSQNFDIQRINVSLGSFDQSGDESEESEEEKDNDANDSEKENDFIFEEEEEELPSKPSLPFWYGSEEPKQLQAIFQVYSNFLKLHEEAKKCIREPIPFVGRIKRMKVLNSTFTTIDRVDVYKRCLVPPESPIPIHKTFWILTNWSQEEGLPTQLFLLQENTKSYWKERIEKEIPPSFLVCLPTFSKNDFHYLVLDEELTLIYSYSQQHPFLHHSFYNPYIPEELRYPYQDPFWNEEEDGFC